MENGIYIGLSRQIALQRQMTLLANNVANINTPGFKAQKPLFEEYISKPDMMDNAQKSMSLVYDYGQFKVEAQGSMKLTGNPLDIALDGPGWMMVETPEGTKYTRAGNFTMNAIGELVTPSGNRVLDAGQKTITIPSGSTDIRVTENGDISTSNGVIGRLGVMEFENVQDLRPTGDGFYTTEALPQPALETKVRGGMIEGSNVQGVLEMTNLIEISRKYQSVNRMLQSEHERQRTVIRDLTEA
jgi:flagellar basal-body rod protein FlgF